MTTKEKILLESLKLFSVQGYDAVSVRDIAKCVGVGNSALYKHFSSKQAIFDALVEECKEQFFAKYSELYLKLEGGSLEEICLNMFSFQTENDWIVMFRKMLIIEQFKNGKIAETYKMLFVDMPIENQTKIFKDLIKKGIFKNKNPEVMAVQLYAPFYLYHTISYDRTLLEKMFKEHINTFLELYVKESN